MVNHPVSLAASISFILLIFHLINSTKGIDIGVHELRSIGTSVMRRTLSNWQPQENDLTRQEETILELIKDSPWALFPLRDSIFTGGRRNTVNFRPRLGREGKMIFTETSRSPPFAPRLGRVVPFSPRFGRMDGIGGN